MKEKKKINKKEFSNSIDPDEMAHHEPPYLGPVVQSVLSLTSSLRSQLVKCFTTL